MLEVYKRIGREIEKVWREKDRLYLSSAAYRYRIEPRGNNILRVTVTARESFEEYEQPGILAFDTFGDWEYEDTDTGLRLRMRQMLLEIDKATAAFTYYDQAGRILLRENPKDPKLLEKFTSYRLAEGQHIEKEELQTADGKKQILKSADKIADGELYHTRMNLLWQKDERIYGLGQQEEGFFNLRGRTVYVHQGNRKIAVPMLVSDAGYGILMNTYSPMIFSDGEYGSYLYTEADREMDFFVIVGNHKQVVKGYRFLTGKAAMLPKWAFGYLQSQERYETQKEILDIAAEYRKRDLGLDGIVLDWCSWEDGMWGQKSFDEKRFPDAKYMTEKLHEMDVHFMISIWPNMDEHCENYKEFASNKLLLPGSNVYNAFSEEGRRLYWKQVEEKLYCKGIDSWWCDSSEPYTPEWNHVVRPEPFRMYEEYCRESANYMPTAMTNAFALYHARALYEGQRNSAVGEKEKRVFNLTRSAYIGQQRYGTVMWSGDIGAGWDTYRRQIRSAQAFSVSGLPYWTTDIGAFFVKTGEHWYWDGEYPDATEDLGYRELFVRWYQWETFLPIFRGHGTDCRRELWQFGDEGEPFYEACVKANHLRYELMPYLYSLAGRVWLEDASFLEALPLEYVQDPVARDITDQFLLGEGLMVCPVTEAMYYEVSSKPVQNKEKVRRVYLPENSGWYDYFTGAFYEGGQWITVSAKLEEMVLFVKEGSMIPTADFTGSVAQKGELTWKIYGTPTNGFKLYEDAGDGYDYENGDYSLREFSFLPATKEIVATQLHGDSNADYITSIKKIINYDKSMEEAINEKTSI